MSVSCANCSKPVDEGDQFCPYCNAPMSNAPMSNYYRPKKEKEGTPELASDVNAARIPKANELLRKAMGLGGVVGALVGGIIGFLLRPSVPLIGQLDFGAVISRGSNLRGMDQLLVSTAETSFNYLVVGAIIGGMIGFGATYLALSRTGGQINTKPYETPDSNQRSVRSTPQDHIAGKIETLADLKNKGILSEEEFQTKKKELLDRI